VAGISRLALRVHGQGVLESARPRLRCVSQAAREIVCQEHVAATFRRS
jgi:hypothetical protein